MVVMLLETREDLVAQVVEVVVFFHAPQVVQQVEMVMIHQQLLHKEIMVEQVQLHLHQIDHKKLAVAVELVLLEQTR
tara:strand:+ start:129 stop:359 length:231 start_codon:yes stop_codon:yes gene_type:complete